VNDGAPGTAAPIWAQRSTGAPRIKGTGDLVEALAKADDPEQVLQVVLERSAEMKTMASSLPAPMAQLLSAMSGEARRATGPETSAPVNRGPRPRTARSSTRVANRFVGLRRRASGTSVDGVGADRIMGLAKRLNELILLAESGQRDAARSEVRMAEDSAAARAEGNAEPAQATNRRDLNIDIDALGREVLEAVSRELELRRERRQEDSEDGNWW
jgi:hypothetical protein